MQTKVIISILLSIILIFGIISHTTNAAPSFELYYSGSVIENGIIHYQGENMVIGISSGINGFTAYMDGTPLGGYENCNYAEYSLHMPSGAHQIYIVTSEGSSPYAVYNFYHDTIAEEGAIFTYASYEVAINEINNISLPVIESISYIGEVLDQEALNTLFSKYKSMANLSQGQQYKLSGWVRVRVFNSDSNCVGEYNCDNGATVGGYAIYYDLYDARFGWPTQTLWDFDTRSIFTATKPFTEDKTPTPTPTATPTTSPTPTGQPTPTPTLSPSPTPTATPVPTPVPNIPPVAIINADNTVKAGTDVLVHGNYSYDPDGSIVDYIWNTAYANGNIVGSTGSIWYDKPGSYDIGLTVVDNRGGIGSVSNEINVIEPYPEAVISFSGSLKENRKVNISAESSKSPAHFPIDQIKTKWTIAPVSGGTVNDIKFSGPLTGVSSKDVLFKAKGTYRISLKVTNTAGLSSYAEKIIAIAPDLAPIADFEKVSVVLRDPNDANQALIKLRDLSASSDNDIIQQRTWTYRYDSDNDGNFIEETPVNLASSNSLDMEVKVGQVGKYLFDLSVKESFGQPTIELFVANEDYRSADTSGKVNKLVEVINTAPTSSFEMQPKKLADIEIQYDSSSGLAESSIQSYINTSIIPVMASNGIDINLTSKYVETGVSVENAYPQGEVLMQPANNPFSYGDVGAYVTGEYLVEYQSGNFVVFNNLSGVEVKRYSLAALSSYSQADLRAFAHSKDSALIYFLGNYRTVAFNSAAGQYNWVTYNRVICVDYLSGKISWTAEISQRWDSSGIYTAFDSFRSGIIENNLMYIETSGSNSCGIITLNPSTGAIISQQSFALPSGHTYVGMHHQTFRIYTYYVSSSGCYNDEIVNLQAYDIRNGSCTFYKPYTVLKGGHKYFVMMNKDGLYLVVVPRVPYIDDVGYDRRFVYSAVFDLSGNTKLQYNFNPPWGQWYVYYSAGKTDKYIALQMYDLNEGIYRQTHVLNYTTGKVSNLPMEQGNFNVSDSLVTHMGEWIYIYRNYDERSMFLISFNTKTGEYTRSFYNQMTFQVVSKEFGVLRHGAAPWALNNYSFIKLASLRKEPGYSPKGIWLKNSKHFSVYISSQPILDEALSSDNLETLINNNAAFAGMGTAENMLQIKNFVSSNANNGLFIDNTSMASAFPNLANYIVDCLSVETSTDSTYVLAGSNFDTKTIYFDREKDPKYTEKWIYEHSSNYFENSNGVISDNGIAKQTPYSIFEKVGRYDITYQVRDNPLASAKFDAYRLWSLPNATFKTIFVHRAPIAKFNFSIAGMSGNNYLPAFTNLSYDLDHISLTNKGIQAVEARWQIFKEGLWHDGFPELLLPNTIYSVMIKVRDIDGPLGVGAWSEPFMLVIDTSILAPFPHPPTINVDPISTAWSNEMATVNISVEDSFGDYKQTYYAWNESIEMPSVGWSTSSLPKFSVSTGSNGVYYLHIRAIDNAGYSSYKYTGPYRIDKISPEIAALPENADKLGTNIEAEINVTDIGGSGFKELMYAWSLTTEKPNDGWVTSLDQKVTASNEEVGSWYLHVNAKDNAGNTSDKAFGAYKLRKPVVDITFNAVNKEDLSNTVPAGGTIILISDDSSKGVKISSDIQLSSACAFFNDIEIGDLSINTPVFVDGKYIYFSNIIEHTLPEEIADGTYNVRVNAVTTFGSVHSSSTEITVRTPVDLSIEVENTDDKLIYTPITSVNSEYGTFNSALSQYSNNIFKAFASQYVSKVTINFYQYDSLIGSVNMQKNSEEPFWFWESQIQEGFFDGVNFGRLEMVAETTNGNMQSKEMTFFVRRIKLHNLRITSITDYQWKDSFIQPDETATSLQIEGITVKDMPVYKNKQNNGIKLGYMVGFSIDSKGLAGQYDEIDINATFAASDGMNSLYYADIYVQDENGEYVLLDISDYVKDSSQITLTLENRKPSELEPYNLNCNTWDFNFFLPPTAKIVKRGESLNLYSDNTFKDKLLVVFDIIAKKASGGTYNYTEHEILWSSGNGEIYGSNLPSGLDLLNSGINHGEVFWYDLKETSLDDLLIQREW